MMEPLTTIGLGIIASFAFKFVRGEEMAGRASDLLREKLFGEAKTATDLKDRMWARLYEHTDLEHKVTALKNAKNPVYSFRDLGETFREAVRENAPGLEKKVSKALAALWEDKEAYRDVLHEFQLSMLWELLARSSPQQLRKRKEDVIRDYGRKLRTRCQIPDLAGVKGALGAGVEVESIFVTLSFLANAPAGGLPRIHSGDVLKQERVRKYLDHYGEMKPVQADELFASLPRKALLILGMPGAGKTTLLKYQSLQYFKPFDSPSESEDEKYLPVFIRLQEFVEYQGYLRSRISEYLKDRTGEPLDEDLLDLYLKTGHAAIFYDGLDEIADIAQRNRMARDISEFVKDYPAALHVISCRIAGYRELTVDMSSFAKYTVDDMHAGQRRSFIEKWYHARESLLGDADVNDLINRLVSKIEGSDRLRRLAVNPLMLTIMAMIYGDLRDLPDTRLELYTECVDVLMRRRSRVRGQRDIQRLERMMPPPKLVLGELAYGLHKESEELGSGIAEPMRNDIEERLTDIIVKGRKVDSDYERSAIRNREVPEFCGIIDLHTSIMVDRGMGRYGFVHQTFQEYFAAYYLNAIYDIDELWKEIKDKIRNSYWNETMLLLAEMLTQRMGVLDALLEKIIADKDTGKEESSRLLLLADIIIQGTPVSNFFKYEALKLLYERCAADGEFFGNYVDKLEQLGKHGLREHTYELVEKDVGGSSHKRREWGIRYFSIRDDLIAAYMGRFEKAVEPHVGDRPICEFLLPLLGDLKRLAVRVLRTVDVESLTAPWYLPPVLPFYYRYLTERDKFSESDLVLGELSTGMFVYSSSLTLSILALALDLARDLALALALARARARARARVTCIANDAINDESIFHAAMVHVAALLEIVLVENTNLPPHLTYALEKEADSINVYVRAARLFRRFIRREITLEEELEFQKLLNIEDEEIRHVFDLAYLTDPETREPIFRFRPKL
ncbi:NACHT domain-containing protein [Candidatus Poribacteria bacterium]